MTQLAITAIDNINLFSNYYLEAKALYSELGALGAENLDRINRMDRINSTTNPVNPVNPVQTVTSFSAAPDSPKILDFISRECNRKTNSLRSYLNQNQESKWKSE
ncbi:MAG TPA: hypothetical protein VF354_06940 [Candidatus Methanoperedens sp.]